MAKKKVTTAVEQEASDLSVETPAQPSLMPEPSKELSMTFPVWRYHETLLPEGKIVYSASEFAALGTGWVDSPTKFAAKPARPEGCLVLDAMDELAAEVVLKIAAQTEEAEKKKKK